MRLDLEGRDLLDPKKWFDASVEYAAAGKMAELRERLDEALAEPEGLRRRGGAADLLLRGIGSMDG